MRTRSEALPTVDDVRVAARALAGNIRRTPLSHAARISEQLGCRLFLKLENMQYTGSFKDRGSLLKLQSLDFAQRGRGVVAASAGNHAQGVAHHGRCLGISTTIVMPEGTPFGKVRRTAELGARVILRGEGLSEATAVARELVETDGLTLIHPYDDPKIVSGQGTVALEMLEDEPDLDIFLVPVGGGGLISGIATVVKALRPDVEVIGVQSALYPSLRNALQGLLPPPGGATLAEGIAVKTVGALNLEIIRQYVDDVVLVDEESVERAIHLCAETEKIVVEGAGAAPVAALLSNEERFRGKRVGAIVSGGNIDTGMLASIISRVRLHEGRVVKMRVSILDSPGALARVALIVAEHGANVLEVAHQRSFADVPAKMADLDLTIETQQTGDVTRIVTALHSSGFATTILDVNRTPA